MNFNLKNLTVEMSENEKEMFNKDPETFKFYIEQKTKQITSALEIVHTQVKNDHELKMKDKELAEAQAEIEKEKIKASEAQAKINQEDRENLIFSVLSVVGCVCDVIQNKQQ